MWILGWLYMTCEDLEIWKDVWILGWRFGGKVAYQRYKENRLLWHHGKHQ